MKIDFLNLDEVLALHADQIERYGGRPGLRDLGLLRSAIAVPAATYAGAFLHRDVFEMAGAYLFHLARDHPFVDGNKRTALMATIVFLGLNGVRLQVPREALIDLVVGTAEGRVSKAGAAVFLSQHARRRSRRRG